MIESIEIKNFKSIKSKYFPLRNLNLLLGLNGMGKSSFIQTLLCLKQSDDRLLHGILDINNEYAELGKTKDVLYQYSKNEDLALNVKFSNDNIDLQFNYIPEADYFGTQNIAYESLKRVLNIESLFGDNFQYLNANRFEPIHMHRQKYRGVVEKRSIGKNGEFTAHFIEVYGNESIEFESMRHPSTRKIDIGTGKTVFNDSLLNQINLWMGEISPNVNIVVTSISSDYVILEYQFKQPNLGFTNKFRPQNVGFGISYGLPIVVALLAAKPGQLLILENPESHIHPRGQAELGKLIALAAMNDIQVIVETHSDHIINGIRVAIKENQLLKDRAIMFYFEKEVTENEQYSKITNIEIDKNGELSEYPEHMMDEWSNQLLKLL